MAGRKGGGGVTFTKDMPNFLARYSGAQHEEGGIAAAIRRHDDDERAREDDETERPVVVEALDALPSKARQKKEARLEKEGRQFGRLFERAEDRFAAGASRAVAEHAERQAAEAEAAAAAEGEGGKIVFKRPPPAKRKAKGEGGSKKKLARAGAGALSFTEDDE